MAAQIAGARAITYAAARAFDEDERAAAPLAAQAKLLACDVAVSATQAGQLMHGGWGYAEEYPISRYVAEKTASDPCDACGYGNTGTQDPCSAQTNTARPVWDKTVRDATKMMPDDIVPPIKDGSAVASPAAPRCRWGGFAVNGM